MQFRNLIEALDAAPGSRPFVTAWIDEDEREPVTFAEFRRRARGQAAVLCQHGVTARDRVVIIMPQGIPAMTTFVGAMMLGAAPTVAMAFAASVILDAAVELAGGAAPLGGSPLEDRR